LLRDLFPHFIYFGMSDNEKSLTFDELLKKVFYHKKNKSEATVHRVIELHGFGSRQGRRLYCDLVGPASVPVSIGPGERLQSEDDMTDGNEKGPSSGPLRIYKDDNGNLFVIGFGLWLEVRDEEDGRSLIAELEENGYRICS
jgi:hypothetical protein